MSIDRGVFWEEASCRGMMIVMGADMLLGDEVENGRGQAMRRVQFKVYKAVPTGMSGNLRLEREDRSSERATI